MEMECLVAFCFIALFIPNLKFGNKEWGTLYPKAELCIKQSILR
jgi:hypothetical protein